MSLRAALVSRIPRSLQWRLALPVLDDQPRIRGRFPRLEADADTCHWLASS